MKTVYIIEDEAIMRDLLCTFLTSTFPDVEILGTTGDGSEGLKACLEHAPDLVIVDLQLPDVSGLEILQRLKHRFSEIKILIFTGDASHKVIKTALEDDVDGFINKISGLEELEKAINAIQRGEKFFSPEIHKEIVRIRKQVS